MSKKKNGSEETAIVNWDAQLALEATTAMEQEASTAIGSRIKITDGDMELPDGSPVPGNAIACVILDSMIEHVYYTSTYDPDAPDAPECFALGRDEEKLTPHKVVVEAGTKKSDVCKGCTLNDWGTSERGRGKACKSVRRLAVVVAGTLADEGEGKFSAHTPKELAGESVMSLKVPVTSVKAFASYVRLIGSTLKRPPAGVVTRIRTEKDKKTKFKILFECLGKVDDAHMRTVITHKAAAQSLLEQPYAAPEEKAKGKGKGKKGAKGKPGKGTSKGPSTEKF